MASQNLVSATLTDADQAAVKASLTAAQSKLPFLISLTNKEKKRLRKMGSKSVDYVKQTLLGATNFPNYLPASFDTPGLSEHSKLIDQLMDIQVVTASLLESINDTIIAAGSDAMIAADQVYGLLKTAAKNDSAVKSIVAEIAKRYEAQSKPRIKKTTPVV